MGWYVRRCAIAVLAAFAATSMQGCLPPDWSFCDCDYRDNYWNTVLNDVHMLWDVKDETEFVRKARDNTTYQGRYLQKPPPGLDCPMVADRFWKAWPQYGMTRGLIEGSMGDLWMPGARDRFKTTCMSGHLSLVVICSQHFLVKAARSIEAGEPDHMKYMEAAYGHMVSIRNLAAAYQLRNCLRQEGWSLDAWGMMKYTERWIGKESEGTSPVAAYMGGQMDPWQMLYTKNMAHTERSRKEALPHRQPCVPLKNPQCWKRMSKLVLETCEHCCSPFIHTTGRGDPRCFDSVWTYERCCNTDYKDLVCKLVRKGEEGGCVDCKKTVLYECLTPPEKRLQDAQKDYNAAVDKYHSLQKQSQELATKIVDAKRDLIAKDEDYRTKAGVFNEALHIWSTAFNNRSRLLSEARFRQQNITWNNSAQALTVAKKELATSKAMLQNKTQALKQARGEEAKAREAVKRNETAHAKSVKEASASRQRLSEARHAQSRAAALVAETDAASLSADARMEKCRDEVRLATDAERRLLEGIADALDSSLLTLRAAESAEHTAAGEKANATAARDESAASRGQAHAAVAAAAENISACAEEEAQAEKSLGEADDALASALRALEGHKAELDDIIAKELSSQEALMDMTNHSDSVRCLLKSTPANASARPENKSFEQDLKGSCVQRSPGPPAPPPKDKNEFCGDWAKNGECTRNPGYMLKSCAASCAARERDAAGDEQAPSPERLLLAVCPEVGLGWARRNPLPSFVPDLILELAAVAEAGPTADEEFVAMLAAAQAEEIAARANVSIAKVNLDAARALVTSRENVYSKTTQVLQDAQSNESSVRADRDGVARLHQEAVDDLRAWEGWQAKNESSINDAANFVQKRFDELAEQRARLDEANATVQLREEARKLADEDAVRAADNVTQLIAQCKRLEEKVDYLNSSLNENLTTIVSQWIEVNNAAEQSQADAGWSATLISAAARALVSVVSSIEKFLNNYVVDIKDKDDILRLVHTIDELKASRKSLKDAEAAQVNATASAAEALSAVRKSVASRKAAEGSVAQAQQAHAEAGGKLEAARGVLNQTMLKVEASRGRLDLAKRTLEQHDDWLRTAESVTAAAEDLVRERQAALAAAREALAEARTRLEEANAALAAAETQLANLEADAAHAYFRRLQERCGAGDREIEAYREERELLSLLRAGVLHREAIHAASSAWHAQALANRSRAEGILQSAKDAVAMAKRRHQQLVEAAAAADAVLELRELELQESAARLVEAQARMAAALKEVASLDEQRQRVASDVTAASKRLAEATVASRQAAGARSARQKELVRAMNTTVARAEQAALAELKEDEAEVAMTRARDWLPRFVRGLQLEAKEEELKDAKQEESRRSGIEAKAAEREARMRKLLATHQRHFKLLNDQTEVNRKEGERVHRKGEFSAAEKSVVASQEALDKLVKEEETCHENIGKTHADVERLLKEHGLAMEAYNKQDPEDRKRSFSTKLEGSGPDPGGVDVR